jgi:hypothetical protein
MTLRGGAVLAFWHDLAPDGEAEFVQWHNLEHIPERVGIEGFLRGRRYEATGDGPRYFVLYETESLGVLEGAAYLERLQNPTPWTQRALPLFRNPKRTACRTILTLGAGVGAALGTLDFGPAPGREADLRLWLTASAMPAVTKRSGVVGVHLCEADEATTGAKSRTAEGKLQDRTDVMAGWVLLVEAVTADVAGDAFREHFGGEALAAHGAAPERTLALYRLAYCLDR